MRHWQEQKSMKKSTSKIKNRDNFIPCKPLKAHSRLQDNTYYFLVTHDQYGLEKPQSKWVLVYNGVKGFEDKFGTVWNEWQDDLHSVYTVKKIN